MKLGWPVSLFILIKRVGVGSGMKAIGMGNISWKGWQHIIPLNDLVEHRTDTVTDSEYDTYPCICNPRLDYEYQLVIHSAMDRREVFENDNLTPN